MSDSRVVVQFAEMVRRDVDKHNRTGQEIIVWLGTLEQVRSGELPAVLLDKLCPVCDGLGPHMLTFLENWRQYQCLNCGVKHSDQVEQQPKRTMDDNLADDPDFYFTDGHINMGDQT